MRAKAKYILTERLHGDLEGKLHVHLTSADVADLVRRKEEIITARSDPTFGKQKARDASRNLEIWGAVEA